MITDARQSQGRAVEIAWVAPALNDVPVHSLQAVQGWGHTIQNIDLPQLRDDLFRLVSLPCLLDVKDIPQVGPLQWGADHSGFMSPT